MTSLGQALRDPDAFSSSCGKPLFLSTDLLFDFDSDTLRAASRPALRRVVGLLQRNRDVQARIVVRGHADPRGTDAYNDALSTRRAQAIARWFVNEGHLPADRVDVQGVGEREPLVGPDKPGALQRYNRRVEVVVPCSKGGP